MSTTLFYPAARYQWPLAHREVDQIIENYYYISPIQSIWHTIYYSIRGLTKVVNRRGVETITIRVKVWISREHLSEGIFTCKGYYCVEFEPGESQDPSYIKHRINLTLEATFQLESEGDFDSETDRSSN